MKVASVVYVVLSALHGREGAPNGHLYASVLEFDVDIEMWTAVIAHMERQGWIKQSNFWLSITPKGEEMWVKLEKEVERAKVKGQIALAIQAGAETTE